MLTNQYNINSYSHSPSERTIPNGLHDLHRKQQTCVLIKAYKNYFSSLINYI